MFCLLLVAHQIWTFREQEKKNHQKAGGFFAHKYLFMPSFKPVKKWGQISPTWNWLQQVVFNLRWGKQLRILCIQSVAVLPKKASKLLQVYKPPPPLSKTILVGTGHEIFPGAGIEDWCCELPFHLWRVVLPNEKICFCFGAPSQRRSSFKNLRWPSWLKLPPCTPSPENVWNYSQTNYAWSVLGTSNPRKFREALWLTETSYTGQQTLLLSMILPVRANTYIPWMKIKTIENKWKFAQIHVCGHIFSSKEETTVEHGRRKEPFVLF